MTPARGFPAFPRQRAGARFATSWWGRAWIQAMEDTSLDAGLLRKGRAYAKTGQLGPITVSPGRLAAVAQNDYDVVVSVEQLSDDEWERFLDQVAAKAGHIAALLDGDMPHDLVEAAEDAAVPLLPSVGDLEPECSCPDWGHPCVHAAALCYQASWLLDADPFVLLLLRGRGERELVEALQDRDVPAGERWAGAAGAPAGAGNPAHPGAGSAPGNAAGTAQAGAARSPGTPASVAFAAGLPPLPEPPPYDVTFVPPALDPAPGVDVAALQALAASAAARARELLLHGRWPELTEHEDHVRLLAEHIGDAGAGDEPAPAVAAWRYGGAAGLAVLERPWTPPRHDLARARARIEAAWEGEPPPLRSWRNRWTFGDDFQLRYGRDGRWYPFTRRGDRWWPAGPPERDPSALIG